MNASVDPALSVLLLVGTVFGGLVAAFKIQGSVPKDKWSYVALSLALIFITFSVAALVGPYMPSAICVVTHDAGSRIARLNLGFSLAALAVYFFRRGALSNDGKA